MGKLFSKAKIRVGLQPVSPPLIGQKTKRLYLNPSKLTYFKILVEKFQVSPTREET